MKLVTFQSMDAYESLIKNGYLETDKNYINKEKVGYAYSWIVDKMNEKIKNNYDKFAEKRQQDLINGMKPSHHFVEKPMMKSMMHNLKDKKILMLGCGTGE